MSARAKKEIRFRNADLRRKELRTSDCGGAQQSIRSSQSEFSLRDLTSYGSVRVNIMPQLTARQEEVLAFIRRQQQRTGYPPSSREIQNFFGFQSQTAAMNHLRALEKKGVIRRTPGKARSAVDPNLRFQRGFRAIPLLGQIPAGLPVDSAETEGASLSIDPAAFGIRNSTGVFALKVRGESMSGAQIADGDTVILQNRMPRNGDIVAALIDGETTLKRYLVENGSPYLKAENPAYPNLIPAAELSIQGVMIGLLRQVP
jgi:repressor LexA